jgi:predicted RNA binding protein YcfA (HicA-like mRNA interferase family)
MPGHDLFRRVSAILKDNGYEPVRSHGGHFFFQKDGKGVNVSHGMHDKNLAKKILKQAQVKAQL